MSHTHHRPETPNKRAHTEKPFCVITDVCLSHHTSHTCINICTSKPAYAHTCIHIIYIHTYHITYIHITYHITYIHITYIHTHHISHHIHTYHPPYTTPLQHLSTHMYIHIYITLLHPSGQHVSPYCSTFTWAARLPLLQHRSTYPHARIHIYISHNYTYCSTCGARSTKLVFVTQTKATPHPMPARGGGVHARYTPNRAADVLSSCSTPSHITRRCCHSVNWRSSSRSKRVGALSFRRAGVLLNGRMSWVLCYMSVRRVGVMLKCRGCCAACP